ncbi:hypothetical protein JCM5296_004890 [Sporobolomyces johnsonii]
MHLVPHLLLVICGLTLLAGRALAVWPLPRSFSRGSSPIQLSPNFEIVFAKDSTFALSIPADLVAAIKQAEEQLENDKLQRLVVDRGEADRPRVHQAPTLAKLELSLTSLYISSIAEEANKPYEELEEGYTLDVPLPGDEKRDIVASLSSNTTLGLARGLQTFSQLVYVLPRAVNDPTLRYVPNAPISISDKPAFSHRAVMLDTARNFYAVQDIIRTLEVMASLKLNVFHWHATDSQSWPLFVPAFPDLTEFGAYSSAEVYSLEDIKTIHEHAGGLGITVMLEIDLPGHTGSIHHAFPDYVSCYDKRPWALYAAEPPAGQLKLGLADVLEFTQRLLQSVAPVFPSKYFSTGGDEVNALCYLQDPDVSVAMAAHNATLDDLLSEFVRGTHETLRKVGKTPVVWEEMVLKHDLGLGEDTIVTVWMSSANVRAVAEQGYRIIHAASDYFYLDCGAGGWLGNNVDGNSWCDPFKTWQKIYSFDPFANLTESQHSLVMGGEALAWSEQISPTNLDSMVWPRAAAAAEVFWTGGSVEGGKRSVSEALPRLHDWRYRAINRGVGAAPLQPHWCALRPGACDLTG